MPVHKCRPMPGAAMLRGRLECAQARLGIGSVNLGKMEVGKIRHQPRNVAARRVHLDRHADRIAIVLDHEDHRQFLVRRRVQRLPEFPLRRGSFAHAGQHHFIAMESHIVICAIVAFNFGRRLGMAA